MRSDDGERGMSVRRRTSWRLLKGIGMALLVAEGTAAIVLYGSTGEKPAPAPSNTKFGERLVWTEEMVPTRTAGSFDSIGMFAIPSVEPSSWPSANAPAPLARSAPQEPPTTAAGRPEPPRRVAALPPARPASHPPARPAAPAMLTALAEPRPAEAERRPLQLLGWTVPGSEYLPTGRDARAALDRVASLPGALGEAVADGVGLR